MRVVLWGAHPRRAVYVGSRADRRLQARLGREAKRRRRLGVEEVARVFDVPPHLVATVRPGDLLVLQAEHRMSEAEVERLRAQFRAIPDAPRAMILDGGVRLTARVVEEAPRPFPSPALPCFEDRAFRERWYAERGLTPPGEAA